ncbi:unnamed protein product [Phytomonas sp. EM1]|nr:unnamed protein product [Phytomonas sp. EM1]|eukprot:CCW59576.1 unnamed protein product [Phytomonas sp. isolate EM1]
MPSHNKRGKAQQAANKEKRANMFTNKSRNGYQKHGSSNKHHRSGNGRDSSYLSSQDSSRQNRPVQHTFDAEDPFDQQLFDYIIVIDVEATCEDNHQSYPHEVIELPAVLIDVRRGLIDKERSFQTYIKPWRNPTLTDFCKKLTGIRQEDVDGAPDIKEAIKRFEKWYLETIPRGAKAVFAADGPWDFRKFFYEYHVLRDNVSLPSIFYEYLDIRTTFSRHFNHGAPMKLEAMLSHMGLKFKGRPHCGFDDAYNIARLAITMMKAGCVFDFLVAIPLEDRLHYHLEGYPLYRRKEGSGQVDRDVIDDIAKKCFGQLYFTFGKEHRAATLDYRVKHPSSFKNSNAVFLHRQFMNTSRQWRWWWIKILCVLILFAGLLKLGLVWYSTVYRQSISN